MFLLFTLLLFIALVTPEIFSLIRYITGKCQDNKVSPIDNIVNLN